MLILMVRKIAQDSPTINAIPSGILIIQILELCGNIALAPLNAQPFNTRRSDIMHRSDMELSIHIEFRIVMIRGKISAHCEMNQKAHIAMWALIINAHNQHGALCVTLYSYALEPSR